MIKKPLRKDPKPSSQIENYYSKDSKPVNISITLPEEITAISDTEMRDLHARIVAWLGYRQTQLINSTIALNEIKNKQSLRAAHIHSSYPQSDKWRFENICKRDEQWKNLNSDLIEKEAEVTALGLEIDKLEKRAAVLSREQSYRERLMASRM